MRPRLGFLGVGWIGRNRMHAVAAADMATIVAVADTDHHAATTAAAEVNASAVTPEQLLGPELDLDGAVIATPSALHADQSLAALRHGRAVFCQKPLARTGPETRRVVDGARDADRLLGVDMSYRHLAAVGRIRDVLGSGAIGEVYAADLTFHNSYGPDKPWFTDPALAGGGCVMDLGIHLVDLTLWLLDAPKLESVTSRLFARGRPLDPDPDVCEDYAVARLDLASGATATLTCSWFLHAGADAVIGATFHGTRGSVALHNVDGSFYDFVATHRTGTSARVLAEPPDEWGGRAAVAWVGGLAAAATFDPAADDFIAGADVIDRIYGR